MMQVTPVIQVYTILLVCFVFTYSVENWTRSSLQNWEQLLKSTSFKISILFILL